MNVWLQWTVGGGAVGSHRSQALLILSPCALAGAPHWERGLSCSVAYAQRFMPSLADPRATDASDIRAFVAGNDDGNVEVPRELRNRTKLAGSPWGTFQISLIFPINYEVEAIMKIPGRVGILIHAWFLGFSGVQTSSPFPQESPPPHPSPAALTHYKEPGGAGDGHVCIVGL